MQRFRKILKTPHYGFEQDGRLVVPSFSQLVREVFVNTNVFNDRRNWLTLLSVSVTPFFLLLWLPLLIVGGWSEMAFAIFYAMFCMNIHNTAYLHRFAAHGALDFASPRAAFLFQNLTLKVVPEEAFVISHQVHHALADRPGDPHNPSCGWLSVMLSDGLTHAIRRDLSESEYLDISRWMEAIPVQRNSYPEYLRWGSISHPLSTFLLFVGNWLFWGLVFFFIGGPLVVCAGFAGAGAWGFSVRNFNFKSHGGGRDRRKPGRDFSHRDFSVNNMLAGWVAGEWHSNHHVTPASARNDYLPGQLDLAWGLIRLSRRLGLVRTCRDGREEFLRRMETGR